MSLICLSVCVFLCSCVFVYVQTCVCMYVCMYVCIYIHTYIHTYRYTHAYVHHPHSCFWHILLRPRHFESPIQPYKVVSRFTSAGIPNCTPASVSLLTVLASLWQTQGGHGGLTPNQLLCVRKLPRVSFRACLLCLVRSLAVEIAQKPE